MSAAAGAGASTGAVPSAEAIASRERFIQNEVLNPFCFGAVDVIANTLRKKKNLRFFVKGGAAATLLLTGNPRGIVNDIDCAVLVNPTLSPRIFEETRIDAANHCIRKLVTSLNGLGNSTYEYIQRQCERCVLKPRPLLPPIRIGWAALDGADLKAGIERFITEKELALKPDCPLFIDVWPSLIFRGESLQMAVIKLCTRTEPSLSLVDIAIPAQSYSHLPYEWENYMVDPITVYKMKIPILSPSAQIYNQERAEALTIRGSTANFNAKANRRRARTAALRARFSAAPVASAASAAPAAVALNAIAAAAIAAGAAGGAGAAAPGASLFPVPLSASSGTRRNNRTNSTRRNRAPINYRSLPLGEPLSIVSGPRLHPIAAELLRTGGIRPARHPAHRLLREPPRGTPAYALLKGDRPPGSNIRLFETHVEGAPFQYLYLDSEGLFQPISDVVIRTPRGEWAIMGPGGRRFSIY